MFKYITEERRQHMSEDDKNKIPAPECNDMNSIIDNIPGGVAVFSHFKGHIRIEYANSGFYELHHGSREYWLHQDPDPLHWLIPEDRQLFEDAFSRVNAGRQRSGNVAYRITGEDGLIHWVNNQFCLARVQDGVSYYYASFTDLDELKDAEQSNTEVKKMYEAAVEEANLVVWEYDIASQRITMAENEFTEYDYRKFGLPKVTENVPQSLLKYID